MPPHENDSVAGRLLCCQVPCWTCNTTHGFPIASWNVDHSSNADLIKGQKLFAPVEHASVGNALDGKIEGVEELPPGRVANTEGTSVQHLASSLLLHHRFCSDILVLEVHLAILERKLADLHAHSRTCITKQRPKRPKKEAMRRRGQRKRQEIGPCDTEEEKTMMSDEEDRFFFKTNIREGFCPCCRCVGGGPCLITA